MEKSLNVTILNVLRYDEKNKATGEKTGKEKIRIGYVLLGKDAVQESEKFRGLAEMSYFADFSESLWNNLDTKIISQPCEFIFEEVPSMRDPLKTYLRLKTINCKDAVISLV